ncbi:MAG: M48 family metalloprotease [Acidobacteriota bacterium]|nr:MAG: M48 family metalloprotease [Acidobacteriota bacterium]
MNQEEYISLIREIEPKAKENPGAYRKKVFLLAVLGYAYIVGIALLPIIVVLAVIAVAFVVPAFFWILIKLVGKFVFLLLAAVGAIFAACWSAFRSFLRDVAVPEGTPIGRSEFPKLFELLDEISEKIKAPVPDTVLIDSGFNASVMNTPRFLFFGSKTVLTLGLPLMEALSVENFRAVLAHEMGHISRRHGRYAGWIYQLRATWAHFLEEQEINGSSSIEFLYSRFVNWYMPFFNAYSFVLAREQEREADRMAAEMYGAATMAESLVVIHLKEAHYGEQFYKNIFDGARQNSSPPKDLFSALRRSLHRPFDETRDAVLLMNALTVVTDYSDTHPSLAERLELLGYKKEDNGATGSLPVQRGQTAAEFFLGDQAVELGRQFDASWETEMGASWNAAHQQWKELNARIEELRSKHEAGTATTEEVFELADVTASQLGDTEESKRLFRGILENEPDHSGAKFALGNILINERDDEGVRLINEAAEKDFSLTQFACDILYSYFNATGRGEEALEYIRRSDRFQDTLEVAARERQDITVEDSFEEHSLNEDQLERVRTKLGYHEEISKAYLVRKVVWYFKEHPVNVLAILTASQGAAKVKRKDANLVREVVGGQVGDLDIHFVLTLEAQPDAIRRKIEAVNGSLIYKRS